MQQKFDYSKVWTLTQTQIAAHREAIAAVAGAFLFLPDWVSRLFAGNVHVSDAKTIADILDAYQDNLTSNLPLLLPTSLLNLFGAVVLYVLLLRKELPSVGAALKHGLLLLPFYFLLQLIGGFATLGGFLLLIIPGFYLTGRLAPLAAVTVAETERGLSGILSRTWELTLGKGWAVFFLILFMILAASLGILVVGMIVGIACRVIAGPNGVPLIETGVDAALGAMITTVMISLYVAIYRTLTSD